MEDEQIVRRISELADEEHALERSHVGDGPTDEDLARLRAIEVALDQCWDLLRQRRARRASGQDADEASVRSEGSRRGLPAMTLVPCAVGPIRPFTSRRARRRTADEPGRGV